MTCDAEIEQMSEQDKKELVDDINTRILSSSGIEREKFEAYRRHIMEHLGEQVKTESEDDGKPTEAPKPPTPPNPFKAMKKMEQTLGWVVINDDVQ